MRVPTPVLHMRIRTDDRRPPRMEELLRQAALPTAELDLDLAQFARVVCTLLDIPTHDGLLAQSLHVVFTLFSEFRSNQARPPSTHSNPPAQPFVPCACSLPHIEYHP